MHFAAASGMIPRASTSSVKTAIRYISTAETTPVVQRTQLQLVQRAQADLAKDLNLAVSSRKAAARRLNGPTLPVSQNGDIKTRRGAYLYRLQRRRLITNPSPPAPIASTQYVTIDSSQPGPSSSSQSEGASSSSTVTERPARQPRVVLRMWKPMHFKKAIARAGKLVQSIRRKFVPIQAKGHASSTSTHRGAPPTEVRIPRKPEEVSQPPDLENVEIDREL